MLFELPQFEHVNVKSIKEAVSIISKYGEAAGLIAGGTDLLALMKDRVSGPQLKIPEMLVNIKTVPEMNTAPRATCQEYPMIPQTMMAKKTLCPIPGANAMGYLANNPIRSVAIALDTQVANITAP